MKNERWKMNKNVPAHFPCFIIYPADARCCNMSCTDNFFFVFLVWYPQARIPSTADTHTGGDAVLGKHEGSPARRHSRNSCHMFVYIVVCACSRHARDFKIRLFRSFVSRKGYCMTKSRRSESIHTYDNTQKICTPEFPILSNLRFCRLCQRGS